MITNYSKYPFLVFKAEILGFDSVTAAYIAFHWPCVFIS